MGGSIALMLYSKYHAVLFVLLILLSNPRLLKNRYFYQAIFLAVILYIPHLLWQVQHGFPSVLYHLQGRSDPLQLHYMDDYILQQIPMIGLGVIFVPFIYKPGNPFDKTLKYIILGTFIFFLLSTLKGFVHFHWTSIVLFPVIILSAQYYSRIKKDRLFHTLMLPFVGLILIARLYLASEIVPVNFLYSDYYHGRKLWAEEIASIAGDRPVIFETEIRALKEAPLYTFYTGNLGVAFYPGEKEKSQYQIWNYEDSVQSRDVLLIRRAAFNESEAYYSAMGKTVHYREIDDFHSYQNIQLDWNEDSVFQEKNVIRIPLEIFNHREDPLQFNGNIRIFMELESRAGGIYKFEQPLKDLHRVPAEDTSLFLFSFSPAGLNEIRYEAVFGFNDGNTFPSVNSKRKTLLIKK
jgi:hypothetical protein